MIDSERDLQNEELTAPFLTRLGCELAALLEPTVTVVFWADPLTWWLLADALSPFGDLSISVPFSIAAAKSLGARKAALWLEPIILHEFKKKINSY